MGFIKNFDKLATTPQRKIVLDLIETALSSIQPEKVLENFTVEGIKNYEHVYLIGFGKGSAKISKIIEQKLGDKLTEGYVIDVTPEEFNKIQFTQGTHPLPSQTNLDFTKKVVERFENKLTQKDLVIVVVTGGGSVLFELPNFLSLPELIKKNDELLKSGLNIEDMNAERKKISKVKGGGLARILQPAKVLGLIFSDVPGNNISTVASGPTDDPSAENILVLSNKTALNAMKQKADQLGINAQIYFDAVQGEAKVVGPELIKTAKSNSVLLVGGETTVTVQNNNGKGGRNQELVLGALSKVDEQTTIASFDSDGWDNTEFAGAIGDLSTLNKAKEQNLNVDEFLNNNNSLEFFQKTEDGIETGRLPSNVSDLMIVYKK
ncbi:MAG TPA: DUF4147 domain-containing protein [Patescibacteria group bacterium]|nr:DUF4147 domain-containing protein [Patescibacteria group bacterium]